MTDIVCSACRVPKPPVCYEHAESRKGCNRDVCLPCITRLRANSRAAWEHSEAGRKSRKRKTQKLREKDPAKYADSIAAWAERRGAA